MSLLKTTDRYDTMRAITFKQFTGGIFETNCFLLDGGSEHGSVLIDAPEGAAEHFSSEEISALVLTHGHFDHTVDAAAVQMAHQCPVLCHPDTIPMISDREFFRRAGFGLDIEPVESPQPVLGEGAAVSLAGEQPAILEVPGHCPGSVCLWFEQEGLLFGGDVLFAGGVGRWDLPGGDRDLLFEGIRLKLYALPGATRVFPGHGPETTIERERASNPFVAA